MFFVFTVKNVEKPKSTITISKCATPPPRKKIIFDKNAW